MKMLVGWTSMSNSILVSHSSTCNWANLNYIKRLQIKLGFYYRMLNILRLLIDGVPSTIG